MYAGVPSGDRVDRVSKTEAKFAISLCAACHEGKEKLEVVVEQYV
jgi:hypothetical protein